MTDPAIQTHPRVPGSHAPTRGGLRADIQGLRAVAVASVLAYHLWPGAVSGGYVGVDVFLVISGYLITAHLLRDPPTGWREVGRFWGRRMRRLLPASALVLVVSVAAAAVVLPASQLARTGVEAVASALYVQNWSLAATATDYLASESAATAFRHYWSLSVEEQFYLVWPLLIGAAVLLGRWWRRAGALAVVVLAVLGGSLAWSVHLTAVDPAAAYYVTTTRMWELALGGAVALLGARFPDVRVPDRVAGPLALAGLAAIGAAVVGFSATTPFPGATALLPTAGTAAVIVAYPGARSSAGRLLGLRPAQVLGDVSYSTYLWHWPLIVLVPFAVGRAADLVGAGRRRAGLGGPGVAHQALGRGPGATQPADRRLGARHGGGAGGVHRGRGAGRRRAPGLCGPPGARRHGPRGGRGGRPPAVLRRGGAAVRRGLLGLRPPAVDPAGRGGRRQAAPVRRRLLEQRAVRHPAHLHLRAGRRDRARRAGRQLARRSLVPAAGGGRRRAWLADHHLRRVGLLPGGRAAVLPRPGGDHRVLGLERLGAPSRSRAAGTTWW